jgi:hypothetical protein
MGCAGEPNGCTYALAGGSLMARPLSETLGQETGPAEALFAVESR